MSLARLCTRVKSCAINLYVKQALSWSCDRYLRTDTDKCPGLSESSRQAHRRFSVFRFQRAFAFVPEIGTWSLFDSCELFFWFLSGLMQKNTLVFRWCQEVAAIYGPVFRLTMGMLSCEISLTHVSAITPRSEEWSAEPRFWRYYHFHYAVPHDSNSVIR